MDRFERLASALRRIPGLEVRENEPMKRHTTFRIGGPARLMALPRSRKEAAAAVRQAMRRPRRFRLAPRRRKNIPSTMAAQ